MDSIYIFLKNFVHTRSCTASGGSHSHQKQRKEVERGEEGEEEGEGEEERGIMQTIINTEATLNQKLEKSQLKLFSSSTAISSEVPYRDNYVGTYLPVPFLKMIK